MDDAHLFVRPHLPVQPRDGVEAAHILLVVVGEGYPAIRILRAVLAQAGNLVPQAFADALFIPVGHDVAIGPGQKDVLEIQHAVGERGDVREAQVDAQCAHCLSVLHYGHAHGHDRGSDG